MIRFIRRWFGGTKAGLRQQIDRLKAENEENCEIANEQIQRQHRENQVMYDENARLHKENIQKSAAIKELIEQVKQGKKDHVQHAYELLRNSCIRKQQAHIVRLKKEAEEWQTTRRLLLDGYSDSEGVPTYQTMKVLTLSERSLEKYRKLLEWSPSRVCCEMHFQNCQVCERMECCDNTNPMKAALVDAAKKVGMLKVRLANCDYYAESALSLGALDYSTKKYLLNIRTEAGIGADAKQAANFRTGEVYKGPVTLKGFPLEWEPNL